MSDVRPRRVRRSRAPWGLRYALALSLGPNPVKDTDLTDAELGEVWAVHGHRLPLLCWGWWRFDPEVPDELRGERPALLFVEDEDAMRTAENAALHLEAGRATWLDSLPDDHPALRRPNR